MAKSPIRVVVVDDHKTFRRGVVSVLSAAPGIEVVGEGGDAKEAIDVVQTLRPDVVILDMNMPGGGLAAVARLSETCPEAILLLFTVVADPDQIETAIRMGAGGYLRKGASGQELVETVRRVFRGEFFRSQTPAE